MPLPSFFTRWWRGADAPVRRALRRLRPALGRLVPPVVDWYVLGWPGDEQVTVYLACAHEADRHRLEAQLPVVEARLREEIRSTEGAAAFSGPIKLLAASAEQVAREGGFFGYSHNP